MSVAKFKIKLAAKVTDSITGFAGVVTGRCEYITGCRQYLVTGQTVKNAQPVELWIDEIRLVVEKTPRKKAVRRTPRASRKGQNGGPVSCPPPPTMCREE